MLWSVLAAALAVLPAGAGAQDAAVFTPTYAASQGSPYSDVYARTFGTTGRPAAEEPPPLETAAAPPAQAGAPQAIAPGGTAPEVVYVIEGGRLLTFEAADYPAGTAADAAPLPPAETAYIGAAPEVQVPTIADRLYRQPPAPAPAGGPIPLLPPGN
ncbi:MAG: hypothetical protein Kow00114_10570 [Kiloniellaceae bacterium]